MPTQVLYNLRWPTLRSFIPRCRSRKEFVFNGWVTFVGLSMSALVGEEHTTRAFCVVLVNTNVTTKTLFIEAEDW